MGQVWREELEIPDLERVVFKLYEEILPLYKLLHAVVRHKLLLKHGSSEIDPTGPIPIHLLGDSPRIIFCCIHSINCWLIGNMWGQDWSSLINLFVPDGERIDLDVSMKKKMWSISDMVRQAEDFYVSLGFPKLPRKFWEKSVFVQNKNTTMCHGTAANMYTKGDYRWDQLIIRHSLTGCLTSWSTYCNVFGFSLIELDSFVHTT